MKKLFSVLFVGLMCFTLVNFNLSAQEEVVDASDLPNLFYTICNENTNVITHIGCAPIPGDCFDEIEVN